MTSRRGWMLSFAVGLSLLGLGACSRGSGLELVPEAVISCPGEDASQDMQNEGTNMLPGRVCGACHRTGGQAANSPWTLAGTIYGDAMAACNSGGLPNVTVQVLFSQDDPNGQYRVNEVQPGGSLTTNDVGNFYSAAKFVAPIKIRILTGDPQTPTLQKIMTTQVGYDPTTGATQRVDCNFCHYPDNPNLAPGRVFLQ